MLRHRWFRLLYCKKSGNSSVGRARPCQGRGREFESRFPLQIFSTSSDKQRCQGCKFEPTRRTARFPRQTYNIKISSAYTRNA